MAVVNLSSDPSALILAGSLTNIAQDGSRFVSTSYNASVQGGRPCGCQWFRTDGSYNYCALNYYYNSGSYDRTITPSNLSSINVSATQFVDNLNSWTGLSVDYPTNNSHLLLLQMDLNYNFVNFVWGSVPSTNATGSISAFRYVSYVSTDSGSGGDSGSTDMSGVVNAILMIPAVLIVLGVFTMIYRMFINRRVRG